MCSIVSLYYENFWWVETWNVTSINGIANSCLYFRATHDLKKPYSLRQNGPLLKRFQYKKSRKSGITESWYHIFKRHKMSNTKLCALFCHMDIAGVSNTVWSIKKTLRNFYRKAITTKFHVNIVRHFHGHLFLWKYMEYDRYPSTLCLSCIPSLYFLNTTYMSVDAG